MAFTRVKKTPTRRGTKAGIAITIHKTGTISLTKDAYDALGQCPAIVLDYDPDTTQVCLTVASPDDPDAFRLDGKAGPKFPGRSLLAHAELDHQDQTVRCPARRASLTAIVADLGGLHRAGITPLRRTA